MKSIDGAAGHEGGALGPAIGVLSFTTASGGWFWTPAGGAPSPTVVIPGALDTTATIPDATNTQLLFITWGGGTPAADEAHNITIDNVDQNMFDNNTSIESRDGQIRYRCFYIKNLGIDDALVTGYIDNQLGGGDALFIGPDPAGIGDGIASGVAGGASAGNPLVLDTDTPTPAVTFTQPGSGSPLNLGTLQGSGSGTNNTIAIWKQVVTTQFAVGQSPNIDQIIFEIQ
ncbi:MAG: hypothetical protein ACR2QC_06920 [Gammaproteobacteria bacterium]